DQGVADTAFVGRLIHQRVVEQAAAELREAGGWRSLHDVGVEAVEGARNHGVVGAALGCIRIDVVIALEVIAIFGGTDQRGGRVPVVGEAGLQAGGENNRQHRCE